MAEMKRRNVLRYTAAGAVLASTAAAGIASLTAAESAAAAQTSRADRRDFDEIYKGKRIRGRHVANGNHELHINNRKVTLTAITTLFVPEDGSAPQVGTGYISSINHYDPIKIDEGQHADGLRRLAARIVDTLGGSELSAEAARAHHH
ncbi:tyrosinase family oxidase copper chaperone [Actinoplanes sp. NPDC051859]|uniref:tyrosinase family oxidase copper chaperone n=1 Tax=Actinoplanes sp. NPDC051859 TaxID=3363909 RepID=UPI0037A76341